MAGAWRWRAFWGSGSAIWFAGVGTILATSAALFEVIKLAGAAYLIWIGLKMWWAPISIAQDDAVIPRLPRARLFREAFLVTMLNPKGIIFFMAFVPQFIAPDAPFAPQATVFVGIFAFLGLVNASAYAWLAGSTRQVIRRPSVLRWSARAGGTLLVGAGITAALARRGG
ncbi:MAG TPA: LysE family translocator [Paracoccaceae bacterium]|nr:LysE family translocator [Paracoccaceae bacterium]